MQKVASCHRVTTIEEMEKWIDSLPVYITSKRREQLYEKVRNSKYEWVLWRPAKVFTVW